MALRFAEHFFETGFDARHETAPTFRVQAGNTPRVDRKSRVQLAGRILRMIMQEEVGRFELLQPLKGPLRVGDNRRVSGIVEEQPR